MDLLTVQDGHIFGTDSALTSKASSGEVNAQ